jgi:phosphate transport system substrate-binding protein
MLIARLLAPALAAAAFSTCALAADITGAGATFPYPIYAKWADAYKKNTGNGLNYQSIGSGGGIKQITAKTVDFGASDMPMKGEDLEKNGLVQFPAIMGGVVPVVKLAGVSAGQLKFTGPLLADIYLGKVKKWNEPAIAKVNPGVKLPDQEITVVYRSDGSGTTFLWTNYLSKTSADFKSTVGEGTSVKFPAGVGGKGNEGVASYVQKLDGAIGYVEYAYAKQNKLAYGLMQNKSGKFVEPEDETFKAAAANADWKSVPGMGVVLTDQSGDKAWPITGASFILLHAKQEKPEAGREVLKFFNWAYKNGGQMAQELDYVPMPEPVVKQIEASWKVVTDSSGKAVY